MDCKKINMYSVYIARILLGGFFLLAGINKLMNISSTAGMVESTGLPLGTLLVVVAIIIEIGAGVALIIGYKSKIAASVLAIFTLVVTFIFHGPSSWGDNPIQQTLFMKNAAILGGLLYMLAKEKCSCKMCSGTNQSTDTNQNMNSEENSDVI